LSAQFFTEIIIVDPLYLICRRRGDTDPEINHQIPQLLTVDQDNLTVDPRSILDRLLGEIGRCDEDALAGSNPLQRTGKLLDLWPTNCLVLSANGGSVQRSSAIQGSSTQKSPLKSVPTRRGARPRCGARNDNRGPRGIHEKKSAYSACSAVKKSPPPQHQIFTSNLRTPPNDGTQPRPTEHSSQAETSRQTRGAPRRWLQ